MLNNTAFNTSNLSCHNKLIQNLGGAVTLSHLVACLGEENDSNNIDWKVFLNILLYGNKQKGIQWLET